MSTMRPRVGARLDGLAAGLASLGSQNRAAVPAKLDAAGTPLAYDDLSYGLKLLKPSDVSTMHSSIKSAQPFISGSEPT
jgi:hypothetical protein